MIFLEAEDFGTELETLARLHEHIGVRKDYLFSCQGFKTLTGSGYISIERGAHVIKVRFNLETSILTETRQVWLCIQSGDQLPLMFATSNAWVGYTHVGTELMRLLQEEIQGGKHLD